MTNDEARTLREQIADIEEQYVGNDCDFDQMILGVAVATLDAVEAEYYQNLSLDPVGRSLRSVVKQLRASLTVPAEENGKKGGAPKGKRKSREPVG